MGITVFPWSFRILFWPFRALKSRRLPVTCHTSCHNQLYPLEKCSEVVGYDAAAAVVP